MGDNMALIIFGIALVVVGFFVAFFTGVRMVAQTKLFELLPAIQGYLIGMGIAVLFFVFGVLLLVLGTRS